VDPFKSPINSAECATCCGGLARTAACRAAWLHDASEYTRRGIAQTVRKDGEREREREREKGWPSGSCMAHGILQQGANELKQPEATNSRLPTAFAHGAASLGGLSVFKSRRSNNFAYTSLISGVDVAENNRYCGISRRWRMLEM